MNTLNIIQSTVGTEEVNVSIISALYNAAKDTSDCTLQGRLHSTQAYEDHVEYLQNRFPQLYLNVDQQYISFHDSLVESLCIQHYINKYNGASNMIGLTKQQAANVTTLNSNNNSNAPGSILNNQSVVSFDELKYFTGVTKLTQDSMNGASTLRFINLKNISVLGKTCLQSITNLSYKIFQDNTVLTEIADNMTPFSGTTFENNKLVLPSSITYIGTNAFSRAAISKLYFRSTTPPTFATVSGLPSTTVIYCPTGTLSAYQTAISGLTSPGGNVVQEYDYSTDPDGLLTPWSSSEI